MLACVYGVCRSSPHLLFQHHWLGSEPKTHLSLPPTPAPGVTDVYHCTGFYMAVGNPSLAPHAYTANLLPTDHLLGPSEYKIYLAPSEALGSLGGKVFPGVSFLVDVKYTLGIFLLIHA